MKLIFKISILLLIVSQINVQAQESKYGNDTKSVQNILDAYYNCISGPIGQERDFDRFRNLFHPSANFTYSYWNKEETKASVLLFNSVEEFIEKLDYLDKKGFYEHEIVNTINEFSTVIQVFSTYTYRVEDNSTVPKKGITSYEIFYDGERYWIMSMFWNIESNKYKIPKKYLEKK